MRPATLIGLLLVLGSCVAAGSAPERPIVSWMTTSSLVCPSILRVTVSYTCQVTIDFTKPEYILNVSEMQVHSDQYNAEALANIEYPLTYVSCTNMTTYQSCKYDLPFTTTRAPYYHTLTVTRKEVKRDGLVTVPRTIIVQTTTKSGVAVISTLFAFAAALLATTLLM
eukprot:TRINITY_DN18036_c0_g1_i2.p1 TRINITY_DN18036_c0_g1~~TRINITY_DN18036_c0_g1_i2.p1  ORF type:complete len:168 (+),score=17.88 TRINITY_DN18036_c0_g1_i2:28-531(+)